MAINSETKHYLNIIEDKSIFSSPGASISIACDITLQKKKPGIYDKKRQKLNNTVVDDYIRKNKIINEIFEEQNEEKKKFKLIDCKNTRIKDYTGLKQSKQRNSNLTIKKGLKQNAASSLAIVKDFFDQKNSVYLT